MTHGFDWCLQNTSYIPISYAQKCMYENMQNKYSYLKTCIYKYVSVYIYIYEYVMYT